MFGIPCNGKGHTFATRFLATAVPAKTFRAHPNVIPAFLKQLQEDMCNLFHTGIKDAQGQTVRAAVVGLKGDYEFFLEVGEFTRSYRNVGTKHDSGMCPDCSAGEAGFPMIDLADRPQWSNTLYATPPWNDLPILNRIPFARSKPQTLYRKDAFHTLKYGFLKDLAAGVIMYMCQLGYFDDDDPASSKAMDSRLERSYNLFKLWCLANAKNTTLRKFSRTNFHRLKATNFPFLPGKGADSVLVCMFLEFYIQLKMRQLRHPSHHQLFSAMMETLQGGLNYIGIYHGHGMFLTPSCAKFMVKAGYRLLKGYCYLAQRCVGEHRKFFALRPKVHYYHHMLVEMATQLERGDAAILNAPSMFNSESNEDFIGRVSRISRRVSPRLITMRTLQRYLVGCKLMLRRAGLTR